MLYEQHTFMHAFLLGICLRLKSLGHTICKSSTLENDVKQIPRFAVKIYTLTNRVWEILLIHFLAKTWCQSKFQSPNRLVYSSSSGLNLKFPWVMRLGYFFHKFIGSSDSLFEYAHSIILVYWLFLVFFHKQIFKLYCQVSKNWNNQSTNQSIAKSLHFCMGI